ncbi:DUF6884 domain-containing protein [Nocardioides bruguierae]|uniref:DUF6884 domain-containing protein n=1 Tax=Nocardioides bruguierae TaxID=2945102 RepID=UPI0020211446|nr:DUF6884 domain-containing protein [Nocardioides bruguierae]MCL8024895.1 hypothetical protein [Nocardioides bruguierae]
MSADWSALTAWLRGKPDTVVVSWRELEDVVGGMPRSSIDHPAFWSGDRPHTRAWRAAGFELASRDPGRVVTFRRSGATPQPVSTARPAAVRTSRGTASGAATAGSTDRRRLILVSCAKTKAESPSAARDLYVSPRFRKARAYAEAADVPWFILSAEHGLVGPQEWLAPYERYLPDTPAAYRAAWGAWVAARLELLAGPLRGTSVEIHAGEAYVQPLTAPLHQRGAVIERPLRGLTSARWQGWYDQRASESGAGASHGAFTGDVTVFVVALADAALAMSPRDLGVTDRNALAGPGLYAWFVDEAGAADLSEGLGTRVEAGLVYVGQTGATRWPSGTPSGSTLWQRIGSQHLGGRRSSSTLRRTVGAILDRASGGEVPRDALSAWMNDHLRVHPVRVQDADTLGDLERQVVLRLDPPLNLEHVGESAARIRLTQLRTAVDPGLR